MGYDAMANEASVPAAISRDFGKKKKVNRSAKLKQCKLDARREQWLSQVKNKGCINGCTGTITTSPSHPRISLPSSGQGVLGSRPRMVPLVEMERDGLGLQDSGLESPVQSPSPGGNMQRKEYLSTSGSSGSSVGSCSRSVSDAEEDRQEEEKVDDKGGLDDWEAVADALSAVGNLSRTNSDSFKTVLDSKMNRSHHSDARLIVGTTKPDTNRAIPRAWKPDDAARPQCLPNLSKQRSFPLNIERHFTASGWHRQTIISAPSSCPICVEDFDLTDSSFLPCSCGFRICLFCHKKILEEGDGRCPGCRKKYDRVACMEKSVTGIELSLPHLISRSCSMNSRS
ncbi:uncharacterized protein LOC110026579 [Phalaenopsis equestris]|uniref:uncharacterized protein LOC110026579 n=1 Tax=Phalaenopsis equestris TaxID=78828 RepID=UPI0009E2D7C2|nr:uncharacterized protein LOC110026579 [Phalaenopsis equestris]